MAFRALLFLKSPETNGTLMTACEGAGIRVEVCDDIFTAIDKGTKQPFSCILVEWSRQPEAGFLLKRARESGPNKKLVAIAIVDNDPTPAEMRDHRLDFLIYRPIGGAIADEEASEVLAKAGQKMQPAGADQVPDLPAADEHPADATASTVGSDSPAQGRDQPHPVDAHGFSEPNAGDDHESGVEVGQEEEPAGSSHGFRLREACAAALVLAAAFFLWTGRDGITYLARTPEGRINVLRESVAALFYLNPTGAAPVGAASSEAQQDAYFSRSADNSNAEAPKLGVVPTEADVKESQIQLRKAADFPLPTPVYVRAEPEPVHSRAQAAVVPESLRGSAPITPPVIVTVNPALLPVAAPSVPPPTSTQSFSEPVPLSEEAERGLLIKSVAPGYPREALAQKLHGAVVLQATIGRDGSVEDLKIIRGYFVLGKAAVAAVKQWRFQPYSVNGHAAQTQTTITIDFSPPPS